MNPEFDVATWAPLPSPANPPAASQGALDALLAWAASSGARFEPIEIRVAADGNRSVYARRTIAAGEPLVLLPRQLMITDGDIAASPVGAAVRRFDGMLHTRHSSIGVWLAHQRRDRSSPWAAYLDALPAAFPWLPIYRGGSELAALAGTRALDVIVAQRVGFDDDLGLLGEMVEELADLPLAEFAWGRCVATSRCFRVTGDPGSVRALVPIVDMFDHGTDDASWGYVAAARRFEVRAARALAAGQEIRIRFGSHENARWLSGHGFAIEANPEDEAALRFAAPADPESLPVGTTYDRRFQRAMSFARLRADPVADPAGFAEIASAARAAQALIDAAPALAPETEPRWRHTCEVVCAGERAILDDIVAFASAADVISARSHGTERLRRTYLAATTASSSR